MTMFYYFEGHATTMKCGGTEANQKSSSTATPQDRVGFGSTFADFITQNSENITHFPINKLSPDVFKMKKSTLTSLIKVKQSVITVQGDKEGRKLVRKGFFGVGK